MSKKKKKTSVPWEWGEAQQCAFNTLKEKLYSPPVLAYADFSKPFVLHTDASSEGLGAVLYQVQDGQEKVIAYASRGLRNSEKHYPAHKLEFLFLKWSVTEKFHDYLYGNQFDVFIDNNPLTYVLSSAMLDATGHKWLAALSNYDFKLTYRSGRSNGDADGLSRRPQETTEMFPEVVKAISQAYLVTRDSCPYARSSGMAKIILQGTAKGARRRGRQKKRWEDNIKEWTGMGFGDSLRAAEDREGWKGIVAASSVVPRRPPRLRD